MRKSKLVSLILIAIVSITVLFMTKDVYAALDLTDSVLNNTTATNNTSTDTGNNILNNTTNNTTNNLVLTTNNTSTINNESNTSLPKTGIADSMPVAILVVVLGISGVYAYRKMQEYRNI